MAEEDRRGKKLIIFGFLLLLAGGGWYLWEQLYGQWYVSTENASLAGNMVQVSAQVGGTVTAIYTEQSDRVKAGQVLVELLRTDAEIALQSAVQELALAVREVNALAERVKGYRADVALKQVTLKNASDEYQRRQTLYQRKLIATEVLSESQTRYEELKRALELTNSKLAEAQLRLGNQETIHHPKVLKASANVRKAYTELHRHRVISAVDGIVARRTVQVGQRVEVGKPLFTIVDLNDVWVEANFKENQLRNLRLGQPVEMTSDMHGDKVVYRGEIVGSAMGTGAMFSLLPPQNATGNWIKIVQRVPVRIRLTGDTILRHRLPIGASLEVTVDTRNRDGKGIESLPSETSVAKTNIYAELDEEGARLAEQIIRENLPQSK